MKKIKDISIGQINFGVYFSFDVYYYIQQPKGKRYVYSLMGEFTDTFINSIKFTSKTLFETKEDLFENAPKEVFKKLSFMLPSKFRNKLGIDGSQKKNVLRNEFILRNCNKTGSDKSKIKTADLLGVKYDVVFGKIHYSKK